jgi:uncharacterized membrane protein
MKAFLRIAILPIMLIVLWLAKARDGGYGMAAIYVGVWVIAMIPISFLINKLFTWLYRD